MTMPSFPKRLKLDSFSPVFLSVTTRGKRKQIKAVTRHITLPALPAFYILAPACNFHAFILLVNKFIQSTLYGVQLLYALPAECKYTGLFYRL